MRRRRSSYWVSTATAGSTVPRVRRATDTDQRRTSRASPGSALGDVRARGDLRAVGQGADPEVLEDVRRHPLQLPQAGQGEAADLQVGVLAGAHRDAVPPRAVVAG